MGLYKVLWKPLALSDLERYSFVYFNSLEIDNGLGKSPKPLILYEMVAGARYQLNRLFVARDITSRILNKKPNFRGGRHA